MMMMMDACVRVQEVNRCGLVGRVPATVSSYFQVGSKYTQGSLDTCIATPKLPVMLLTLSCRHSGV